MVSRKGSCQTCGVRFVVGQSVVLEPVKGCPFETVIIDHQMRRNGNFYRVDWSSYRHPILNQVWIPENSIKENNYDEFDRENVCVASE